MRKFDYEVSESIEKDEVLDRIYNPPIDLIYFFRDDSNNGLTYTFLLNTVNFPFFIVMNDDGMGFYEDFERLKLSKLVHVNDIENRSLKVFQVQSNRDLKLLMPYILFCITNGCYGLICDCQQMHLHKIISYNMEDKYKLKNNTDLDPNATIYLLSDVGIRIYSNNMVLGNISKINLFINEAFN
ncbi:hypothetical protein ACIQZM_13365 [Peribacillus sp. NPDC097206]|uniref:hypothetical protein n=1 Tax=Peribacillus sp. NPDC097206 TaxID=3364398 RepID=UPI00381FF505